MNKTTIEYLTHTWNPLAMRCTPISTGCAHCWHLSMADRLANNPKIPEAQRWAYSGLFSPKLVESRLEEPLRLKKPARIGVQFMGDLFHEEIPAADVVSIYEVMSFAKRHTFVVLTKRPERIAPVLYGQAGNWYLGGGDYIPNVWLGVSVENQKTADERIPWLLQIPAAVHFISVEPMLERIVIDEDHLTSCDGCGNQGSTAYVDWDHDLCRRACKPEGEGPSLNWVIVGAESGPGARPMDEDWVRDVRDQCVAAGTPLFYKQKMVDGKKVLMPKLDGRVWDQYPEETK